MIRHCPATPQKVNLTMVRLVNRRNTDRFPTEFCTPARVSLPQNSGEASGRRHLGGRHVLRRSDLALVSCRCWVTPVGGGSPANCPRSVGPPRGGAAAGFPWARSPHPSSLPSGVPSFSRCARGVSRPPHGAAVGGPRGRVFGVFDGPPGRPVGQAFTAPRRRRSVKTGWPWAAGQVPSISSTHQPTRIPRPMRVLAARSAPKVHGMPSCFLDTLT